MAGSSSCAGFPCESNGTCQSVVGGGFRCDCLPGFTGDRCEKEIGRFTNKVALIINFKCEYLIGGGGGGVTAKTIFKLERMHSATRM